MSTRIVFKQDLPEIGKTYNYFDDGKIRESRRAEVLITEIISFDKIDKETLEFWKKDIEECDHFYTKETDYFIKGDLKIIDETQKIVFVRTIDGGLFSLGWWAGRLDIDEEYEKRITEENKRKKRNRLNDLHQYNKLKEKLGL